MSLEWALTVLLKSALVITVFLGAALGFALLLRFVFSAITQEDPRLAGMSDDDKSEAARLLRSNAGWPRQIGLAHARKRTAARKEKGQYGRQQKCGEDSYCDLPLWSSRSPRTDPVIKEKSYETSN
jgi:hypothetical protein